MTRFVTSGNIDDVLKANLKIIEDVASLYSTDVLGLTVTLRRGDARSPTVSVFFGKGTASYDAVFAEAEAQLDADRQAAWDVLEGLGVATALGEFMSAGRYTNANTFYHPLVGRGPRALTSAILTNTQTFYAPRAGRGVMPALKTNTNTFYAPTVVRL